MSLFSKMFGFDRKKYLFAIDLGTEFAKTLVFYSEKKEEKIIITGAGKERHDQDDIRGGIIYNINGAVETCRKAIEQAESMSKVKPKEVIVGIGGELVTNIAETTNLKRKNFKTKINMNELEGMVASAQENASKAAKKMFSGKSKWNKPKLIGADVVDFSIDGYRVVNPINFKGKNVRINISNVYVSGDYYSLVEKIAENLGLKLLKLSYGPYSVLRAMGIQDFIKFGAIFIDVGGNTTDIVIVKNGNVESSRAFLIGGRILTKSIADGLKVDFLQAENVKIRYSNNKLNIHRKEEIEKIAAPICDIWTAGVELSLRELSKKSLLPSKIFIYGGGSHFPLLSESLKRLFRIEKFSFADDPEVNIINPADIITAIDNTKSLNSPQDITAISLASLSLEFLNEENFPNKILKKSQVCS